MKEEVQFYFALISAVKIVFVFLLAYHVFTIDSTPRKKKRKR